MGKVSEADYHILHRRGSAQNVLSPQVDFPFKFKPRTHFLAPVGAQWTKQSVKMISRILVGVQSLSCGLPTSHHFVAAL